MNCFVVARLQFDASKYTPHMVSQKTNSKWAFSEATPKRYRSYTEATPYTGVRVKLKVDK
jgi:hypothetical protein